MSRYAPSDGATPPSGAPNAPLCWLRSVCANEARQSWFEFRRGPLGFGPSGDEKGINEEMYRMCLQARGYQRVEGGAWVGVRD